MEQSRFIVLLPVTIQHIQEKAKGYKTFTFRSQTPLAYQSGQYLTFVFEGPSGEIRRSYSITSSPLLSEALTIGVKRVENGIVSRHLIDHAREGDVLLTTGAAGLFTLPSDPPDHVYFFAAGSGITPIFSLVKTALLRHLRAVLIYSSPSPAQTFFYEELNDLRQSFPEQLDLRYYFSNARDLQKAHLNRESLNKLIREKNVGKDSLFYTCGPEAYMRMVRYTLQENGISGDHIRREHFITDRKPVLVQPPDILPHTVSLHKDGRSFPVVYPDTILVSARKHGIQLPYSCETGQCGSCALKLLQGEVWLSANEVLTEKDLRQRLTLTCTGHPVGGDIILDA